MLLTSPYSISNTTIVKRIRLASVKVCECPPIRTLPSTNQIRMRIQGAYEHKKVAPFSDLLTETPSEQEKSIVKIIYYCCVRDTKDVKRTVPLTHKRCQENNHAPASGHIYAMRTKYRIHPTLTVPLTPCASRCIGCQENRPLDTVFTLTVPLTIPSININPFILPIDSDLHRDPCSIKDILQCCVVYKNLRIQPVHIAWSILFRKKYFVL